MTENFRKLDVKTLEYVRHLIRREAEFYERVVDMCNEAHKFDDADEFDKKREAMRRFEKAILDNLISKPWKGQI